MPLSDAQNAEVLVVPSDCRTATLSLRGKYAVFFKKRSSADADKPARRDVTSGESGCVTPFTITEKLIARRALQLLEVQWVTSPRLPQLRCLIAMFSESHI